MHQAATRILTAAIAFGCLQIALAGDTPAVTEDSAKKKSAALSVKSAHLLLPGDILQVTVYEHPELQLTTRIDSDGSIRFPLCGKVPAAGKTAGAISDTLSEKLQTANIERAQVFVLVEEFVPRYVYVLGEAEGSETKALEIPPEARITALQAISSAGGFTQSADLRNVFVLRTTESGEQKRIAVNVRGIMNRLKDARDVDLRPGDTVVIPRARPVSVFGMVNTPGSFNIDTANAVSVAEMISRAEGFKDGADRDQTLLLRQSGSGGKKSYVVRMGQVMMKGSSAQNAQVQPGDVIIARPRDKIFVLGQVKEAGAFDIQPEIPMTVTRAIAMAGGFDKLAAEEAVLLIRGTQITRIDLRRALRKGGDQGLDASLRAGDMVFVPESRW